MPRSAFGADAWFDLRFAVRALRRSPAFVVTTTLTLSLGVGATTAIFSAVDGVLLKPLPFRDAHRLVVVRQVATPVGTLGEVAPANFLDWQSRSRSFTALAAAEPFSRTLSGPDGPEMIRNWNVTEDFFAVLGLRPLRGRLFEPRDFRAGSELVIVISYESWQRRYGGDPAIIGRRIVLDGTPATLVGVLPPRTSYPLGREMWSPKIFTDEDRQTRGAASYVVIGRLRAGITLAQADADMRGVAAALALENPRTNGGSSATVVALSEQLVGGLRSTLALLLAAVLVLLAVACINVANLLLARTGRRATELTVRAALGAGRGRLLRQLLLESWVLAVLGSAAGLLLATAGVGVIRSLSPANLPRLDDVRIDIRALLFALTATVITAMAFGLAPALRAGRAAERGALRARAVGRSVAARRTRHAIVAGEIALAVVLLLCTGLLARSVVILSRVDRGYDGDGVLAATLFIWQWTAGPAERAQFVRELVDRVEALPGVEGAAVSSTIPLGDPIGPESGSFRIEGRAGTTTEDPSAHVSVVTPEVFRLLRIPLLSGRRFTDDDDARQRPVVIVNAAFARQYWPNANPIGRRIVVRFAGPPVTREVVGIAGDVRQRGIENAPRPGLFIPHAQAPTGSIQLLVRARNGDAAALLRSVRSVVSTLNTAIPIARSATFDSLAADALRFRRFVLLLIGAFAAAGFALAVVGVYGLIVQTTGERTKELGLRIAIGASPTDVLQMVMREGVAIAGIGIGTGIILSLAFSRLVGEMLYGVKPVDVPTFAAVAVLVLVIAGAATLVPAYRAMRIDPSTALRHE